MSWYQLFTCDVCIIVSHRHPIPHIYNPLHRSPALLPLALLALHHNILTPYRLRHHVILGLPLLGLDRPEVNGGRLGFGLGGFRCRCWGCRACGCRFGEFDSLSLESLAFRLCWRQMEIIFSPCFMSTAHCQVMVCYPKLTSNQRLILVFVERRPLLLDQHPFVVEHHHRLIIGSGSEFLASFTDFEFGDVEAIHYKRIWVSQPCSQPSKYSTRVMPHQLTVMLMRIKPSRQ